MELLATGEEQSLKPQEFSHVQEPRTATTNAAELLGKEKELGALAPGYFADLVAVEGDPLADINVAINNVRWVMKAGLVVVDRTHGIGR